MPTIAANGIELCFETFGDDSAAPLLLVNGFTSQLLGWDAQLCTMLAGAGFYVIRFDNRDVGLSTKSDGPPPNLGAIAKALRAGETPDVPYSIADMAADGVGLLDALGIETAHIAGMSMGGMIVQQLAIDHPARVRSVTSIMSTTGDRSVGKPTPEAWQQLLNAPPRERAAYIDYQAATWRVTSGPLYDEAYRRAAAAEAYERSFWPRGATFQLAAIQTAGDRTAALGRLDVPALVVHGRVDPLVGLSGGEATAAAIPHAKFVVYNDMGHDLPKPLFSDYVGDLRAVARLA